MPTLTRVLIKTSLGYLVLALLLGIFLTFQVFGGAMVVYIHLFVLGWLSQLIFGVVFWMFPKRSLSKPRGSPALGWITYITLNAGLVLRAIGEPLNTSTPSTLASWLLFISAVLLWIAGTAFVANTWLRVKER